MFRRESFGVILLGHLLLIRSGSPGCIGRISVHRDMRAVAKMFARQIWRESLGKLRSFVFAACLFWSQQTRDALHSDFDSINFRFASISTIDSTQQGTFEDHSGSHSIL
eukprot:scaffold343173_cov55-Attheya_sp.AAC.2